ncbi:MAG: shikimate kinase [Geminicoccaceae bacterium]
MPPTPALAQHPPETPPPWHLGRSLVLVGLMGAGKTSIGRRLAKTLGAPFVDADEEIVAAAGLSIPDIFALYGEARFRELERRVVARLLDAETVVLALGGGAFIDPDTRARVAERAVSVWLRADLETLLARTSRKRGSRPLLESGDPREILAGLMERRYPIYAEADFTVDSQTEPHEIVVDRILVMVEQAAKRQ